MATANEARLGHGTQIAYEVDPVGSPGVFTPVARLSEDITIPELITPSDDVTAHEDNLDRYLAGVKQRGTLGFGVFFIYDDATHDVNTGIVAHWINTVEFGIRLRGPGGSTDDDEMIISGFITAFSQTNPVRQGARTGTITYRPSGSMKWDGIVIG